MSDLPAPLTPPPPSGGLGDSPWFWFGMFALMALAALMVVGPRFARRQSQLESNYQGRRDAWQQQISKPHLTPTTADTPSENP